MFSEKPIRRRTYIWQRPDCPQWLFDSAALAAPLAQVHRAQGHLAVRMAELGRVQRDQATLQALTQEVITTTAPSKVRRSTSTPCAHPSLAGWG